MKKIFCLFLLLIINCYAQEKLSELKGPYLGQKPPGDAPELFAPNIVSSVYLEHSSAVFTPNGNEVFWSREINIGRRPRIIVVMHMKQENGVWSQPELSPFNFHDAAYNHINSISPDGKRLYYFSSYDEMDSKIFMVDKTKNGWGEPRLFKQDINELHETKSGNLYCTGSCESIPHGSGIVRSKLVNGEYQAYESLGPHVNFSFDDPYPNHSPTVDPDERFVIFVSRRPGGFGPQDLYISYRQPDDTFGPAINLGEKINTIGRSNSWPQLSPDGKYLFFVGYTQIYSKEDLVGKKHSYEELMDIQESIKNGLGNIYWVNTSFIEELKQTQLK